MEACWLGNRLLQSLSGAGQSVLAKDGVRQSLKLKTVLFAEYETPSFAFLPLTGVASVVAVTSKGETAEVGFIGCEGVVGAYHLLGPAKVPTRCFVQIEGDFLRIPFAGLRRMYESSGEIRSRIHEFIQADSLSVSQMAACNQTHKQEVRLARWLLMAVDRRKEDILPVTHEILGEMISAGRPTVTAILGKLQREGLITQKRGRVVIEDRRGLERAACDCYGIAWTMFNGLYKTAL